MKPLALALALMLPSSAQAADCNRFLHTYTFYVIEFQDGVPDQPVTNWPTLILGAGTDAKTRGEGTRMRRRPCFPGERIDVPVPTHCFRGIEDPMDVFNFWVEVNDEHRLVVFDPNDSPGRAYVQACDILDAVAREEEAEAAGEASTVRP